MGAGDLGPGPKVQKRNGSIVLYDQHPGIEHALFGRETIDGHGMPLKNVSILPHLRDVGEAECASLSKKVVFFHLWDWSGKSTRTWNLVREATPKRVGFGREIEKRRQKIPSDGSSLSWEHSISNITTRSRLARGSGKELCEYIGGRRGERGMQNDEGRCRRNLRKGLCSQGEHRQGSLPAHGHERSSSQVRKGASSNGGNDGGSRQKGFFLRRKESYLRGWGCRRSRWEMTSQSLWGRMVARKRKMIRLLE